MIEAAAALGWQFRHLHGAGNLRFKRRRVQGNVAGLVVLVLCLLLCCVGWSSGVEHGQYFLIVVIS